MARLHPMLQPYTPTGDDPFDAVKAAHLLSRATFGGTQDEIENVVKLGPAKAVDWLLDFPDAPIDEQTKDDVPDLSSIEGYPRSLQERRRLFAGKTPDERQSLMQQIMAKNREAMAAVMQWWLRRMTAGEHPMQEKLTLFWHGHFTTSARDERSAFAMWRQNETLRRNAAGNFGQFLRDISRDPAMLDYLNNQQNRKSSPNENFARELMELFTLGIGNYSEQDIKEAARAFTGWGHDGEEFVFRKGQHDYDSKSFMGRRGDFDGDDIIEVLLQHRGCGSYIAQRLVSFFVHETPDAAVCQSLGAVLRENKYDMRPVLRTMFTSKLFYSPPVIGTQIKSPVQLVVGTMRLLDVQLPQPRALVVALEQMGQVPFAPPNVKGWPGGRAWINTNTLFVRYNTAVWLAGGGSAIAGGRGGEAGRFMAMGGERRGQAAPQFNPTADGTADQIVDAWVARLIQRPIAPDRRQVLLDSLADKSPEVVKKMVQLIVSMPEYQLC